MHLQVTTPRGYLIQTEVDEVAAPGVLGEFDVLPGHIPFMSVLKPGVLLYRNKNGEKKFLAIGDGILQIARSKGEETILVLVDRGEKGGEIDRDASQQELATLDSEISKAKPDTLAANYVLTNKRAWVAARVDAASRSH